MKSFKQFLNEFEIEGEHQSSVYHYYLVNYYNNATDGEFRFGTEVVSKLDSDTIEKMKQSTSSLFVEVVEIDYEEALDEYSDKDWYYMDEVGKEQLFNIESNEIEV